MRISAPTVALAGLVGGLFLPNPATADVFTQANLHGQLYDPTTETVGGVGVTEAQIGTRLSPKTETEVLDYGVTRTISGWTLASAEQGRLDFELRSSIVVPSESPSAQLSAFIQSTNNRVIDQFMIEPGMGPDGPLNTGDPAQVLLQFHLDGEIELQGRPSGGLQFTTQLRAGAGAVNLPLVAEYSTGGLNPPQSITIDEEWNLLIDVTVGNVLGVDALMSGWINGTAFDPGQGGTNYIVIDPIARVSNAPGYDLVITSEAGAPTTPIAAFLDVPPWHWAYSFIEELAESGITVGCGEGNFCPTSPVTRAQMAVFLERGINGSTFSPAPPTGTVFLDVDADDFAAGFIEQLYLDGITSGCGDNNFCPQNPVTRAQMAVFLLRSEHGAAYTPPPPTGVFADVAVNYWAAAWIEQLAAEGITVGCGGGNFCPNAPVTREQMAVFLVRTFDL